MIKIVILYLFIINLIGFFIMLIDKSRAIHKEWRISEKTLIGVSIIGGSIGMITGMYTFRHKTKHKKFTIGVPIILIIQFIILIYVSSIKNFFII